MLDLQSDGPARGVDLPSSDNEEEPFLSPVTPSPFTPNVILLSVIGCTGGFLFGYDTGVVSGALLLIKSDFKLNETEQEIVVASTVVACAVTSLIGGPLNDRYGRRPVLLAAAAVFMVGAVWMAVAPSFVMLVLGRIIIGLGVGLASLVVPVYIAETAPAAIRGTLVAANNIFITGGQFIAGMVAGGLANTDAGWRYMLGIGGIPAAVMAVGMAFMPESPRWLVAHDRSTVAAEVLRRLRPPSENIQGELQEMEADVASSKLLPDISFMALIREAPLRRALTLGCGLQILQQLVGINTVMYYAATIYEMVGYDKTPAIWLAGFTALAQTMGNVVGSFLAERSGRRKLTLVSLALVSLCLVAMGLSFLLQMHDSEGVTHAEKGCDTINNVFTGGIDVSNCYFCVAQKDCGFCQGMCLKGTEDAPTNTTLCPTDWGYNKCASSYGNMAIVSMVAYLLSFGIGMSVMPWVINAEIFPLRARALGTSVSTATNWTGNILVSATFLTIASPTTFTKYGAFWVYSGVSLVGLAGLFFTLPETKGKSLEEIEALFTKDTDRVGNSTTVNTVE